MSGDAVYSQSRKPFLAAARSPLTFHETSFIAVRSEQGLVSSVATNGSWFFLPESVIRETSYGTGVKQYNKLSVLGMILFIYLFQPRIGHMGIDLRGGNVGMAEQCLY